MLRRIVFVSLMLAAGTLEAFASAGFSCETAEGATPKLTVAGATPRSGSALINFGGLLEIDGSKIEFKQSDAKSFAWRRGGLRLRVSAKAGDQTYNIIVDAKADPKDEDEWFGTYELTIVYAAPEKAKAKAAKKAVVRGKVKCSAD